MESNILLDCAREFDKIFDYNYLLTVGKARKITINISLSCASKDFTHIIGLDHLSDIKELSSNKSSVKISAFHNILSEKLTFSTISKSKFFLKPFNGTYNSSTKSEYMLAERIVALKDIAMLLDNAYKGKFYKWNNRKSYISLPDGKIKQSIIKADFMLAVPSISNPQEKYIFLCMKVRATITTPSSCIFFLLFPIAWIYLKVKNVPIQFLQKKGKILKPDKKTIYLYILTM